LTAPSFRIRPAKPSDADQISEAHIDSIHSLGAKFYSPGIVSVWGAPRDGARYRRAMENGELFFIAVREEANGEKVLGFSSYRIVEGKHRTAVYVRGSAARIGVGKALFGSAEAAAKERSATEIHVDASLAAVKFYKACGFEELSAGQHRMGNSVFMDCVFMKKKIGPLTPRNVGGTPS
jgi:putative acetyltransferase